MQFLQDLNTFHWSRITFVNDSSAILISIKIHVFSDSTLYGNLKYKSTQHLAFLTSTTLATKSLPRSIVFCFMHSMFLWEFVWFCFVGVVASRLKQQLYTKKETPMLELLLSVQHKRTSYSERETHKTLPNSQFDEANLEDSEQIGDYQRFDQE